MSWFVGLLLAGLSPVGLPCLSLYTTPDPLKRARSRLEQNNNRLLCTQSVVRQLDYDAETNHKQCQSDSYLLAC